MNVPLKSRAQQGWNITTGAINHGTNPNWYEQGPRGRAALKIAKKLAMSGVVPSRDRHYTAPWLPVCESPIEIGMEAQADQRNKRRGLSVSMHVPCRKCQLCLEVRQNLWRKRVVQEITNAPRSWFTTLTFSPVHLAGVLIEAKKLKACHKDPIICHRRRVERAAYSHVQKYLKRLRKEFGVRLRYVAVSEYGELEGRLHYHLVIHEESGPLTSAGIQRQWRSHVHTRLVQSAAGAGRYLSKYLTKDTSSRMRASLRYGLNLPERKAKEVAAQQKRAKRAKRQRDQHIDPPHSFEIFFKGGYFGGNLASPRLKTGSAKHDHAEKLNLQDAASVRTQRIEASPQSVPPVGRSQRAEPVRATANGCSERDPGVPHSKTDELGWYHWPPRGGKEAVRQSSGGRHNASQTDPLQQAGLCPGRAEKAPEQGRTLEIEAVHNTAKVEPTSVGGRRYCIGGCARHRTGCRPKPKTDGRYYICGDTRNR